MIFFSYVDRLEEGVKEIEKLKLKRHAVVSLDSDACQFLLDSKRIKEDFCELREKWLEDKISWAHNKLRTKIYRLAEILKDEPHKGIKILNSGYPEIKDELIDMLIRKDLISQNRIDTLMCLYGK